MTKKKSSALLSTDVETAPLEAYPPQALILAGEDFIIRACDGDHEYVWIATKARKGYDVMEVYPGLAVAESAVREATEVEDLDLGTYPSIPAALEYLTQALFEDFEPDFNEPANADQLRVTVKALPTSVRQLRSGNAH